VLVGFGQVVCLPVGPRCDVCLLAKEKICPARVTNGNYKGRKDIGVSFEEEDEATVKAEPKLEIEIETTVKVEPELVIGSEAA
jgi:endonuclease-3